MSLDALHQVLSGQTTSKWRLRAAGLFVLFWFGMDVHQYLDFLSSKIVAPPVCWMEKTPDGRGVIWYEAP